MSKRPLRSTKSAATMVALCVVAFVHGFVAHVAAQGTQTAGFVLVNTVASPEPIMASYNGKDILSSPGLRQGSATSGLGVDVGSGVLSVTHPELGTAETALEIDPATTPIVVAFAEIDPPGPGKPAKRKLALHMLQTKPSKQAAFRVFYAAGKNAEAARVSLNKQATTLSPWLEKNIPGRSLDITAGDKPVGNSEGEADESCAVFIARDEAKGLFAVFVPEIIYRW